MKEFLVKDLLAKAIEGEEKYFTRFDIVINYLSIENYYGKNNFGWNFYNKYQENGFLGDPLKAKEKFIELIQSFEKNGLSSRHPLKLGNLNYSIQIRDGAHRFACVLYFGYNKVYACIKNPRKLAGRTTSGVYKRLCDVGSHRLIQRGFTEEEIQTIRDKKNEILKRFGL